MMRVAAIQFAPNFKDFEGNIARMEELILEAATEGAELIVLPELATVGYSFLSSVEAEPYAETISILGNEINYSSETTVPRSSLSPLYRLAKRLGVVLVWGFVEKDSGTGKLYNSQVYVDPGSDLSEPYFESYRKINRWGNDFLTFEPGNRNPPIIHSDSLRKRIGLLICRDIRDKKNDSWSNFYSPGDADVVAFSSNWGKGGFPATNWMDFAEENKVWLIVANRYGLEVNNDFGLGGSCIIDPKGKVYCDGLKFGQDCIIYAEIP